MNYVSRQLKLRQITGRDKICLVREEVMFAETRHRVSKHTPEYLNEKIMNSTNQNLLVHGMNLESIAQRLKKLDREWETGILILL